MNGLFPNLYPLIAISYPVMKKTILVLIDNLGRGGAETLLMGILPELNKKFSVIIVTLSIEYEFGEQELICAEKYSLGFQGKYSFLPAILKLKRIIKKTKPQIIHAHLFYSSIVARAACPPNISLVYSLHSIMSNDVFNNSWIYTFIEKLIFKRNHAVIAVSDTVLEDYERVIGKPYNSFVLRNYVADNFLSNGLIPGNINLSKGIKLVAVGNIKPVKNYSYLLEAFKYLKHLPVILDIYGKGHPAEIAFLQKEINCESLAIQLKGSSANIAKVLPGYDLYVMCSKYEGCPLSPIEAAACGLPLLLSDLDVLKEVSFNNGLFFNLEDPLNFVRLVTEIMSNKYDLNGLSANGIDIARSEYNKQIYLKRLFDLYSKISAGQS